MSESLIEQVRKVVGFQQRNAATGSWDVCGARYRVTIDFSALLAHMQAHQAVVDAARKLAKHLNVVYGPVHQSVSPTKALLAALDAALAALCSLDTKAGG